jgi:type I restriction enzyme, S subunit
MLANWRSLTPSVGKQETGGWLVGSDCLRLRVHRPISAPYLTDYLGHPAVRDWIARNATGSAIPSLNTKTLGSILVVIPPVAVQSDAAEMLGALDEKIAVHDQISRTTAELRDALLPLLAVGKNYVGLRAG